MANGDALANSPCRAQTSLTYPRSWKARDTERQNSNQEDRLRKLVGIAAHSGARLA
jgi:hypothetical protein